MTLSVIWKSEGRIHLVSDSRIALGQNQSVDIGIKVMAIPIRINGIPNAYEAYAPIFSRRFGFCFAGSLVNAYTFKELIEEILQNIQYTGDPNYLSFLSICDCLKSYSSRISTEICSYMYEQGKYEFYLTGYCPSNDHLEAVKFTFTNENGEATSDYTMVAEVDQSYDAIGTGANQFIDTIDDVNRINVMETLNSIIDDPDVPSVGGDIQYGSFDPAGDFFISGVIRKSLETAKIAGSMHGPTVVNRHRYRGFTFYGNDWDYENENFHISIPFIELDVPSNDDSNSYFRTLEEHNN